MIRDECVPQIRRDWDMSSASLSPMEGFLLSRIDGNTSCAVLREIGGMPPEEVASCLERWLAEGVICLPGESSAALPKPEQPPAAQGSPVVAEEPPAAAQGSPVVAEEPPRAAQSSPDPKPIEPAPPIELPPELLEEIDPSLDLSEEDQRRILAFSMRLSGSAFELLGVDADSDTGEIKQAYFSLSRTFHPDRYFGKRLGEFQERIEEVFRQISDAYRYVLDPANRDGKPLKKRTPPPPTPLPEPTPEISSTEKAQRERQARLEREKRRAARREKMDRQKSREPYNPKKEHTVSMLEEARRQMSSRDWIGAEQSLRLAAAFDSRNKAVKEALHTVQAELAKHKKKE